MAAPDSFAIEPAMWLENSGHFQAQNPDLKARAGVKEPGAAVGTGLSRKREAAWLP